MVPVTAAHITRPVRQIAFGYSTQCNIRCGHCVAADASPNAAKMEIEQAASIIDEMACSNVSGISFTAGEPLLYYDDICRLLRLCRANGIYARVVTNSYWARTAAKADQVVAGLLASGLSQLRLSFSRWHQAHIDADNIVRAASSCQKLGLDYFVSFVTDFSKNDDTGEQFLRRHRLKFFPEPVIYFGRAGNVDRPPVATDYRPNLCAMNPYLTPERDMYACCDGADRFMKTRFLYLGSLRRHSVDALFRKKETHLLYQLIRTLGLTAIASFSGMPTREIVQYRKCELCEKLFNDAETLRMLTASAASDLADWRR